MYTDGGSRGNPGPAAAGAFIKEYNKECSKYLGVATNNEAEYEAPILGLRELKKCVGKDKIKNVEVTIYMDSLLAVQQLNRSYKLKSEHIISLFITLHNLCTEYKAVEFIHIVREKNKKADALVNKCLDAHQKRPHLFE